MPLFQQIAVGLMALGSLFALLNALMLVLSWRTGRHCSVIPLVGGLSLGAGMLLLPQTRPFAWLGPLLDFGTLAFLFALPGLVRELYSTSRFNLLEEYLGEKGRKTVRLRLFRKGLFTVEQHIQRPRGEHGLMGASTLGTWQRSEGRLVLSLYGDAVPFKTQAGAGGEELLQSGGFGWNVPDALSLAGVELKLTWRRPA
jgi:hypothetical protein